MNQIFDDHAANARERRAVRKVLAVSAGLVAIAVTVIGLAVLVLV